MRKAQAPQAKLNLPRLDALIKTAARYEVVNLHSIDTSLEEIFLAYYGAGDGIAAEEASHAAA